MMEEMDVNQQNLEKSYQEIEARDVALITYQRILKLRKNNVILIEKVRGVPLFKSF